MRNFTFYAGVTLVVILGGLWGYEPTKSMLINLFTSKPRLELTGNNPYNLTISDFEWSYGITSINRYNGDFEKLDKKVFKKLNGKDGVCKIYLNSMIKDQYGKEKLETNYIGDFDLSDLNKYESWEYWHKNSGIISLLNNKYLSDNTGPVSTNTDSELTEAIEELEPSKTSLTTPGSVLNTQSMETNVTKFSITHEELYPDLTDRDSHDFQTYTDQIAGTIQYADFYRGVLEVKSDDGQLYALRLIPDELPTSLKSDVRYFMRAGNRIACIATVAGARELIIVSATFTSNK